MNIALSGLLIAAGLYILLIDVYAARGILFARSSRYLLSISLLSMAGFSGAIASDWIRGTISRPPARFFLSTPRTLILFMKEIFLHACPLILRISTRLLHSAPETQSTIKWLNRLPAVTRVCMEKDRDW